jgi:hypothetical protein
MNDAIFASNHENEKGHNNDHNSRNSCVYDIQICF